MLQYLKKTWSKNNGNLLLSVAVAAGIAACACWYFDLFPQIELRPSSSVVGATADVPETLFVATVVGPPKPDDQVLTGYLELHSAYGPVLPDSEPIIRKPFQLGSENVVAIVVQEVAPAAYMPIVFLDLNANDALDFDADGNPAEPVRNLVSPLLKPANLDESDKVLDLNDPAYITFQFNEEIKTGKK